MRERLISASTWVTRRLKTYFVDSFRVDTRALAVFRVFAGVLVLADLALRSRNLVLFYSDEGVVPVDAAVSRTIDHAFSVHYVTGDPTWTAALFVLQALIAVQLIIGYKTRVAAVFTFLLVVSLDHRNPFVLSYADTLFRLLLFWGIFLPLGERWSVDAVHRGRRPRESYVGLASAAILLQMVAMYFINGLHKQTAEVWRTGEASPLVLGLTDITWFLAPVVREFPNLLQYGGLLWYLMMLGAPLLLILQGRPRALYAGLYFGGHAAFAVTTRIGAFPYVAFLGLIPFFQTRFWDDAERAVGYLGLTSDSLSKLKRRCRGFAKSLPAAQVSGARVEGLRLGIYWAVLLFAVSGVLLISASSLAVERDLVDDEPDLHNDVEYVKSMMNVDQPTWSIFAPNPRTTDRYYVFPAKSESGEKYDVFNDRELTYERPHKELHRIYDSYRERFYMNSIRRADSSHNPPWLLKDHLCETWGDEQDVELTHLNMYYVAEDVNMSNVETPLDREGRSSEMHRYGCGVKDEKEIDPPPLEPDSSEITPPDPELSGSASSW